MEELTDLQTVVHVCTVSVLFCIISPNICKYGPWYSAVIVLSWQWNIFMYKWRDECIRSGWRLNEGYELDVGMYPNLTQLVGCITRRSKRLASATAKNSAGGSSTSTRVVLFTHTNTNTNTKSLALGEQHIRTSCSLHWTHIVRVKQAEIPTVNSFVSFLQTP